MSHDCMLLCISFYIHLLKISVNVIDTTYTTIPFSISETNSSSCMTNRTYYWGWTHSVTPVLYEAFPHSWQSSTIVIPVMLFGPIKNLWPQDVHSYSRLMTVVRASSDNLRRTQPLKFAFCLASSHVVLHNVTFIGRILGSKSQLDISYAHALPRKPSKHYQKPRFTPLFPSPNSLSASFPLSPCWNWWAINASP